MRLTTLILALFFCSFYGCGHEAEQQALEAEKARLIALEQLVMAEQALAAYENSPLVHLVYLNVKDDLTVEQLAELHTELQTLGTIETVKAYEIGAFEDLGDARAMSEMELVLSMRFADKADYESYQQHPTHLSLKEKLGPYLAGPPVTYDFMGQ